MIEERVVDETEVTDEMLTEAMRAFERMSSVLRYREKDKWHTCDMIGMREAIKAALLVRPLPPSRRSAEDKAREILYRRVGHVDRMMEALKGAGLQIVEK